MNDQKTFNRDNRGDDFRGPRQEEGNKNVDILSLIAQGLDEAQVWQKLKSKFGDSDQFDRLWDIYRETKNRIEKKARKFKQVILTKYQNYGLPYSELLKKAKKYAQKYNLSDDEFSSFMRLVQSDKVSSYNWIPSNKMSKVLGYDAYVATTSKLKIQPEESGTVEQIINKYGETKPLHAQVVLQSLVYTEYAPQAITGKFCRDKHNPYAYIHPVVAALFLPKINYLDEQMLIANIGYIVKTKSLEMPIMTKPDFDLYWAMITDKNDLACDSISAIQDLKNRFDLQVELWNAVLNLRQGKYYYTDMGQQLRFMKALENCRNIIHDAPDLTYVKDEGTILRRILSAFSLHPTTISVNKLWGLTCSPQFGFGFPYKLNPYANNYNPYEPVDQFSMNNTTSVPMITLRLPMANNVNNRAVSLEESLTQPQWFAENKTIVPKSIQIIHSRDVLFFYVGRRYQNISISRINTPYCFNNLPMTVSGFESLNDFPVNAQKTLVINNDIFELRSVVTVEKTTLNNKSLIIGSTALFVIRRNLEQGNFQETYLMYDPQGAGEMFKDPTTNTYTRNDPITVIPGEAPLNNGCDLDSFMARARTRGTIFMYQKVLGQQQCVAWA